MMNALLKVKNQCPPVRSERFVIYDLDDTHLMVQPQVVEELQVPPMK